MTRAKPLPDIARCACGRGPTWFGDYYIGCACGWIGPDKRTERGAVLAWNRVMDQHASHVAARLTLCYRLLRANKRGGTDALFAEIDEIIYGGRP